MWQNVSKNQILDTNMQVWSVKIGDDMIQNSAQL